MRVKQGSREVTRAALDQFILEGRVKLVEADEDFPIVLQTTFPLEQFIQDRVVLQPLVSGGSFLINVFKE